LMFGMSTMIMPSTYSYPSTSMLSLSTQTPMISSAFQTQRTQRLLSVSADLR